MARKTLADFNYNYQAYADYLQSPECANDDGYDTYVDHRGNIYESDDWTRGHGHKNVHNGYNRDKNDRRRRLICFATDAVIPFSRACSSATAAARRS